MEASLAAAALLRKRRAALERDHSKNLVASVERMIPHEHRSKPTRNGAGSRSVGGGGRALNDVLHDLIAYVKVLQQDRQRNVPSDGSLSNARTPSYQDLDSDSPSKNCTQHSNGDILVKDVLFSARDLLCLEVEIGGEQDWLIRAAGHCAARYWGAAPWLGDLTGHSLSQLVHRHDFESLQTLGHECCSPFYTATPSQMRIVTFATTPLGTQQVLTCRYQSFELHLHPLQSAEVASSSIRRFLLLGNLRARAHSNLEPFASSHEVLGTRKKAEPYSTCTTKRPNCEDNSAGDLGQVGANRGVGVGQDDSSLLAGFFQQDQLCFNGTFQWQEHGAISPGQVGVCCI